MSANLYQLNLPDDATVFLSEEEYQDRAHLYGAPSPLGNNIFLIERLPLAVVADEIVADLAEPVAVRVTEELLIEQVEPAEAPVGRAASRKKA